MKTFLKLAFIIFSAIGFQSSASIVSYNATNFFSMYGVAGQPLTNTFQLTPVVQVWTIRGPSLIGGPAPVAVTPTNTPFLFLLYPGQYVFFMPGIDTSIAFTVPDNAITNNFTDLIQNGAAVFWGTNNFNYQVIVDPNDTTPGTLSGKIQLGVGGYMTTNNVNGNEILVFNFSTNTFLSQIGFTNGAMAFMADNNGLRVVNTNGGIFQITTNCDYLLTNRLGGATGFRTNQWYVTFPGAGGALLLSNGVFMVNANETVNQLTVKTNLTIGSATFSAGTGSIVFTNATQAGINGIFAQTSSTIWTNTVTHFYVVTNGALCSLLNTFGQTTWTSPTLINPVWIIGANGSGTAPGSGPATTLAGALLVSGTVAMTNLQASGNFNGTFNGNGSIALATNGATVNAADATMIITPTQSANGTTNYSVANNTNTILPSTALINRPAPTLTEIDAAKPNILTNNSPNAYSLPNATVLAAAGAMIATNAPNALILANMASMDTNTISVVNGLGFSGLYTNAFNGSYIFKSGSTPGLYFTNGDVFDFGVSPTAFSLAPNWCLTDAASDLFTTNQTTLTGSFFNFGATWKISYTKLAAADGSLLTNLGTSAAAIMATNAPFALDISLYSNNVVMVNGTYMQFTNSISGGIYEAVNLFNNSILGTNVYAGSVTFNIPTRTTITIKTNLVLHQTVNFIGSDPYTSLLDFKVPGSTVADVTNMTTILVEEANHTPTSALIYMSTNSILGNQGMASLNNATLKNVGIVFDTTNPIIGLSGVYNNLTFDNVVFVGPDYFTATNRTKVGYQMEPALIPLKTYLIAASCAVRQMWNIQGNNTFVNDEFADGFDSFGNAYIEWGDGQPYISCTGEWAGGHDTVYPANSIYSVGFGMSIRGPNFDSVIDNPRTYRCKTGLLLGGNVEVKHFVDQLGDNAVLINYAETQLGNNINVKFDNYVCGGGLPYAVSLLDSNNNYIIDATTSINLDGLVSGTFYNVSLDGVLGYVFAQLNGFRFVQGASANYYGSAVQRTTWEDGSGHQLNIAGDGSGKFNIGYNSDNVQMNINFENGDDGNGKITLSSLFGGFAQDVFSVENNVSDFNNLPAINLADASAAKDAVNLETMQTAIAAVAKYTYSTLAKTIVVGTKLTNTWSAPADIDVFPVYNDSVSGSPHLNYQRGIIGQTNVNRTFNPFDGISAATAFTNQPITIPDLGTNEWILFSDLSTGTGASVAISTNQIHLKL